MDRIILHSDLNNFYASVECVYNPELKKVPMAVVGDQEKRHGIVLAKNELAKTFGVKTAEPIWQARKKCPEIVLTKPNFGLYSVYSRQAQQIYYSYTNLVEPFGPDECWLDVTGSVRLFGDGRCIADEIRERMKKELGLSVSVGVSFNKSFAKLGSDYKKPDATTVITRENFKTLVWGLPVSSLIFAGKMTVDSLKKINILSIGDLANADFMLIERLLGKSGVMLWQMANGLENEAVQDFDYNRIPKSVGQGVTLPYDLIDMDDIKSTLIALSERVSYRMRKQNLRCKTVQISIKDTLFKTIQRQARLDNPSNLSKDIYLLALKLFEESHHLKTPVRSLTVRGCDLTDNKENQLSLFFDEKLSEKELGLEIVVDEIRERFGSKAIRRGIVLKNGELDNI